MRKVLATVTNYSRYCSDAKSLLEGNGFEVVENNLGRPHTFDELRELVPEVDAVVAGVDTWDENVFRLAPKLKVIARFGVGVDNIDVARAREHHITVTNARGINASSVAELAIGLMLCCLRSIPRLNDTTRKGAWERFVGADLQGKRVGLLGFGQIAQSVAGKLRAFDASVRAFDKAPDREAAKRLGVELAEMEDVLQTSDIISLHLPALPETSHIMNGSRFARMKDGSVFINTARGALVDEAALYEALVSGRVSAAAVDVYEEEPARPENPLLSLPNVICTPHTAGETYETYRKTGLVTAQAILDVFNGIAPKNVVR